MTARGLQTENALFTLVVQSFMWPGVTVAARKSLPVSPALHLTCAGPPTEIGCVLLSKTPRHCLPLCGRFRPTAASPNLCSPDGTTRLRNAVGTGPGTENTSFSSPSEMGGPISGPGEKMVASSARPHASPCD